MMTLQNQTIASENESSKIRSPPTRTLSSDSDMDKNLQECVYGEKPIRLRMKPSHVRRYDEDPAGYSTDEDSVHHPVVRSTSSESLLEDLAPVSSNWSALANAAPHRVDVVQLRKIVSGGGIVEDDESGMSHRAVTWRVLMGYLPEDTSQWKGEMLEKRQQYLRLASELFDDTADVAETASQLKGTRRRRVRGSPSFRGFSAKDRKKIPKCLKEYWKSKSLDITVLERLTKGMNALSVNFTDEDFESEAENESDEKPAAESKEPIDAAAPSSEEEAAAGEQDGSVPKEVSVGSLENEASEKHEETPDNGESSDPIRDAEPSTENVSAEPDGEPAVAGASEDAAQETEDPEEATPEQDTPTTENAKPNAPPATKEEKLRDFMESAVLLDEIRKDVVRTYPDLAFFLEPAQNVGRRRYAALERILFIWSKYNRGVNYVQGMNEIAGILYFTLANDQNQEWSEWAEADTYWLFHSLLTEMSDVFVAGMDDHDTGIQGRIHAMQALLARHDPEVREHLDEIGIETSFYAIRWWMTLLSREFLLPDVIRLWDSMFSSTHKDNFLRFICVTMVSNIRTHLLKSDFSSCLKTLHSYPSTNMDDLLESSRSLYLYESQISLACSRGGLSLHQAMTTIESPPALIIAFGFPKGTPPVTRAEQFEKARGKVEANLRGVFGRASKFWNSSGEKQTKEQTGNALALGRKDDEEDVKGDDVYMTAIMDPK